MELKEFVDFIDYQIEYREGEFPYLLARVVCDGGNIEANLHMSSAWLKSKGKWLIKSKGCLEDYSKDAGVKEFVENFINILYMDKKLHPVDGKNSFVVEDHFIGYKDKTLEKINEDLKEKLKEDRRAGKVYA